MDHPRYDLRRKADPEEYLRQEDERFLRWYPWRIGFSILCALGSILVGVLWALWGADHTKAFALWFFLLLAFFLWSIRDLRNKRGEVQKRWDI